MCFCILSVLPTQALVNSFHIGSFVNCEHQNAWKWALPFPLWSPCHCVTVLFTSVDAALAMGCDWEQVSGKELAGLLRLPVFAGDVGGELLSGTGSEGHRGGGGMFSFLENFITSCPKRPTV